MQPRLQFTRASDGVNIAFYDVGQGIPFVFVSEALPFSDVYAESQRGEVNRRWEEVAQTHRLIRYDCRGSGSSDRGVLDFSLEGYLSDLEAVVGSAGLERFVLIGSYAAGPVAVAYAAQHPSSVSHLLLMHTYANAAPAMQAPEMVAVESLLDSNWSIFTEHIAHALIMGWSRGAEAHELALFLAGALDHETAKAAFAAVGSFDVTDLLPRIEAPTLVITSPDAPWPPAHLSRVLAARIPHARLMSHAHVGGVSDAGDWEGDWGWIDDFVGVPPARGQRERTVMATKDPGVVTILFTDIAESTSLTQRHGDARAHALIQSHDHIARAAIRACRGEERKHTGDGMMASFASASRALEAAIEIQRRVAERNEAEPELPLRVRIGLNSGEPLAENGDLFGSAVQLARRVCDHAEPGQILVPEGVRHLVSGKSFLFADQGLVSLKGFEDAVRLFEVAWSSARHER